MSRHDFGHIPIHESGEPLVALEKPEFILEPMYFERGLSLTPTMHLRQGALEHLRAAQKNLPRGYRFKLWDCYRPLTVQRSLFDNAKSQVKTQHPSWSEEKIFQEARKYIAIPDRQDEVPPHNTGGTADLTVVNEAGEELNFGTGFDEFGDECRPYYFHESNSRGVGEEAIVRNRDMLFSVMTDAGFRPDTDEWWHFDYGNQIWALERKEPFAIYGSGDAFLAQ